MEQGQKDQSCKEVPQLSQPPEIRGFYQVDLRLVDALHQIGEANGCPRHPHRLQQGQHLKKRRKLWAPTWQKEVGWAPEAG